MESTNATAKVAKAGVGRKLNVMGHSVTITLTRSETEGNYYLFELVTPPGLGIPPHVHDREDEIIHVVDGKFMIILGEEQRVAEAGDVIFFPRHIPHAFQNIGDTPGTTLWTVVPGGNFEDFFEELAALPADREPDIPKVIEIFARYGMEVLLPQGV